MKRGHSVKKLSSIAFGSVPSLGMAQAEAATTGSPADGSPSDRTAQASASSPRQIVMTVDGREFEVSLYDNPAAEASEVLAPGGRSIPLGKRRILRRHLRQHSDRWRQASVLPTRRNSILAARQRALHLLRQDTGKFGRSSAHEFPRPAARQDRQRRRVRLRGDARTRECVDPASPVGGSRCE